MYAQKQFFVFKPLFFTVVVTVSSVTTSHCSCYRNLLFPRTRLTNASMLVLATAPFKRCQMKLYFSPSHNCSLGCVMYLIKFITGSSLSKINPINKVASSFGFLLSCWTFGFFLSCWSYDFLLSYWTFGFPSLFLENPVHWTK